MEMRKYPRLDEAVWWDTLPNGLTVAVVPRKDFSRKMAYFVTGFGSQHRWFTVDGRAYEAPMGVAHYLEHKLFDMPGRDISAEFAAMGASVNAFTGYDMTAYYFSCTDNFRQCLKLLLEFVCQPYFTEESVEKEQGIIGQEIDMNEDAPETRIFENLAAAMYENHPIKEPILGTRESIGTITPEVLYHCHRAGYNPKNMLLCVVADEAPEVVREIAMEQTGNMECLNAVFRQSWEEPMACQSSEVRSKMEVARPMFQLGFKCESFGKGEQSIYQEFVGDLAAEALFGESTQLYLRLYEEGLIDPSFGGGLDTVPGMAMLSASGDSDDPWAVRDAILEQAKKIAAEGIREEDFLRMKRSSLGGRIRDLDSFDSVCFRICAYHFCGFDYFRFPEVYESVKAEDVRKFIERVVTQERCCLSLIEPEETCI